VSGTNTDRTGDREYRGLLNVNCVVLHRDLGCVGGGGGGTHVSWVFMVSWNFGPWVRNGRW
jgi:hypothetical protein